MLENLIVAGENVSKKALARYRDEERIKNDADIRAGLQELKDNTTLKRTLEELAKLAGVSTQTLRRREWPLKSLKKLKESKKILDEVEKQQRIKAAATRKKEQEDLISGMAAEIGYWFKEHQKRKIELESAHAAMNRYRESQFTCIQKLKESEEKYEKLACYLKDFHGIDAEKVLEA